MKVQSMKTKKLKTARTIKPYETKACGYDLHIPVGSIVSNQTASGFDDSYRFWTDFSAIAARVTGFKNSILHHHLTHYGVNIPAEFCESYHENNQH